MENKIFSEKIGLGNLNFTPFVVFTDGEVYLPYECNANDERIHLSGKNEKISDDIYLKKNETGFTARRVIKNLTAAPLQLVELGFRIEGIELGGESLKDDYYFHVENPRLFDKLILPVDAKRTAIPSGETEYDEVAGNKWCDPGVVTERVGTSPYQPFPAVLFSNPTVKCGIVHGTLSQNVFYHCYLPYHKDGKLSFDAFSAFKDIDYRIFSAGESLLDEWYIGRCDRADDMEHVFDGYTAELRPRLESGYGASNINRDNLVWGTWNDGIGRSVNEKLILDEAAALVKYFPKVRWLQVDDGYCVFQSKLGFKAHGLGVPYEGEEGIDHEKFPHGMKYVTDKIREFGLRPAVWIGGYCPKDTKISVERPDLMCDYSSRIKSCYVLDVSNPETRKYMTGALDTMLYDWGFEGVKHDFWSYAFDVSEPLLHNREKSGYEHRAWWCSEVRRRMPSDAHFQTGCDIVMGNPFLGRYFSNYRYGIDVSSGNWNYFKTNYLWCISCLSTHTGDLFVPNSDAIGMLPGLGDEEATTVFNFLIVTRTMVELAGRYSKVDYENERFKKVRKATCHINNGQDVYFAGFDYRSDKVLPEILYIKTPHFSNEVNGVAPIRTVAVFNLTDNDGEVRRLTVKDLGLPRGEYILTDVWTGEQIELSDSVEFTLKARNSRLLAVNEKSGAIVYDSNVELTDMRCADGVFTAELSYPYDCEITLAKAPKSVAVNGEAVEYVLDGKTLKFTAKCKGNLAISF